MSAQGTEEQESANEPVDVNPPQNLEQKNDLRGSVLVFTAIESVQPSTQIGAKPGDVYMVYRGYVENEPENPVMMAGGIVIDRQIREQNPLPADVKFPYVLPHPVRGRLIQPPRKRYWALEVAPHDNAE